MDGFAYIDWAFARGLTGDEELQLFFARLMRASREGHLSLQEKIDDGLRARLEPFLEGPLAAHDDHYYLRRNFTLESDVVQELERLLKAPRSAPFEVEGLPGLYPAQEAVVRRAAQEALLLVLGGPGSGKSFTAMQIIESFLSHNPNARIVAAAPTGKAAHRLRHPKVETATLHSLILRPLFTDLIIVDECSMIDLRMWAEFLKRVQSGTPLVLIGDPHQLPPVESGSLFTDMAEIGGLIPQVTLDRCLRSDRPGILALAEAVKQSDLNQALALLADPTLPEISLHPLALPPLTDPESAILSPFRVGPFGTEQLNYDIDRALHKPQKPIIITKNSYTLDLMNGDIGQLEGEFARFGERTFAKKELPPFELAWAISIHKSQGSEYPRLHLLLPDGCESFGKSLLYTAITRAKKELHIYASKQTLTALIAHSPLRLSCLAPRLQQASLHALQ